MNVVLWQIQLRIWDCGFIFFVANAEENEGADASTPISLDDGLPADFGAIDVVQSLIEHHNEIFTDANETVWR